MYTYMYYFLSKDWAGSKWCPVPTCTGGVYMSGTCTLYRSSSKMAIAEWCKTLIDETLSSVYMLYSDLKYTPRVPFILQTLKKIKRENFDFVLFFLFFFFLYFHAQLKTVSHIPTICTPNNCSTIRDVPFLDQSCMRAKISELHMYGSKHTSLSLSSTPFCVYLHT